MPRNSESFFGLSVASKNYGHARGMGLVDRVLHIKRIWGRFRSLYEQKHNKTLGRTDEPLPLAEQAFSEARPSGEPDNLFPSDFAHDRLHRLVRQADETQEIKKAIRDWLPIETLAPSCDTLRT